VDKIELLVLGGTWASYPHAYQEAFVRDLFYAANTFFERTDKRPRLSLLTEQALNEGAACKIIGLTLETRPDTINAAELRRLRRYGCTRVQLGLQHTSDAILKKVNRGCTNAAAVTALRLLKDTCYKVDVHLMPNLPGASPEADEAMFLEMLNHPDLQADQWKIYPCEVTPWTRIKQWFDEGSFVPYPDDVLFELILKVKALVHPWIRLNRVIRDIPSQYILGGVDAPNMRQTLAEHLVARKLTCRCIRCREVGGDARAASAAVLVRRDYAASSGREIFLSYETADEATIFGFVRLRLSDDPGAGVFSCLAGAALIRELHVYGQLVPSAVPGTKVAKAKGDDSADAPQHTGFGRALMAHAEELAAAAGCTQVAVIAGIGARNYYRKLGYSVEPEGGFMLKPLTWSSRWGARLRARARRWRMLTAAMPAIAALLLLLLHWWLPQAEPEAAAL
jgi:ELP3 family radical SAM enzyme/protein acetyltransferase